MLEQNKIYIGWVWFALGAVLAGWLAKYLDTPESYAGLGMLALVLTFAAVWYAAQVIAMRLAGWVRDMITAKARTPGVQALEIIARMTPAQCEVVKMGAAEIAMQGGFPAPLRWLVVHDGGRDVQIPYEWIEGEFLRHSTDVYLCPINTYHDGSQYRDWARRFTTLMITNHFAEPSNGNEPARWIERKTAMEWLGIEQSNRVF